MMRITNRAKGARGIQTATGVHYLAPGESASLDVPDADAVGILANPDFAVEAEQAKRRVKVKD